MKSHTKEYPTLTKEKESCKVKETGDELSFLEERAIFIAKVLKVDLKLNINN